VRGPWEVRGGQRSRGLLPLPDGPIPDGPIPEDTRRGPLSRADRGALGEQLVSEISGAIGELEADYHLGPFAVALGERYFDAVQTPNGSLVLPQDRILPFLGGGPLLRSSTLPPEGGVVVALGGSPVDLAVGTDITVEFLQVTAEPRYAFRVYETIVLRVREPSAIRPLLGRITDGAPA
jgi:uncharacterized linocin/CFP29 family protein